MVEQKDVGKKRKGKQTRKDLATKLLQNKRTPTVFTAGDLLFLFYSAFVS